MNGEDRHWHRPGVPHKGWTCIDMDDLGPGGSQLCEMCQFAHPRYVHSMEHPDCPDILRVGRICAEHMEADYVAPKKRERAFVGRIKREKMWAKRREGFEGLYGLDTAGLDSDEFKKLWRMHQHRMRYPGEDLIFDTVAPIRQKLAEFHRLHKREAETEKRQKKRQAVIDQLKARIVAMKEAA